MQEGPHASNVSHLRTGLSHAAAHVTSTTVLCVAPVDRSWSLQAASGKSICSSGYCCCSCGSSTQDHTSFIELHIEVRIELLIKLHVHKYLAAFQHYKASQPTSNATVLSRLLLPPLYCIFHLGNMQYKAPMTVGRTSFFVLLLVRQLHPCCCPRIIATNCIEGG